VGMPVTMTLSFPHALKSKIPLPLWG